MVRGGAFYMENNEYKVFLVGVSDYSDIGVDNLYGKNDVLLMKKAMNEGLHIPMINIAVLGLASEKVKRQDFIDSLFIELSKIRDDDTFIMYFSGHGGRHLGKHYLFFSDGRISTQEIVDLIDKSDIKTKILFIDACNTGTGILSENALTQSDITSNVIGKGTIVLASCREKEFSSYLSNQPISIFTAQLVNAFSSRFLVRKGCVCMEDIANYVSLTSKVGLGRDFNNYQTPVYYANIIGDVYVKVENYTPYPIAHYYSEHEDYTIYSVEDVCTNSAKRYSVKILLKKPAGIEDISDISLDVLDEIRYCDVYKSSKNKLNWSGKHVTHLFMYFGRDDIDMDGNFEYRSIWVDEKQDKTHWYRSAEIINDVGVIKNSSYDMLKRFTLENMGQKNEVLKTTRQLLNRLINDGNQVISLYRAYSNGEMDENSFVIRANPIFKDINDCYFKMSNVDIAPIELSRWSGLCDCVAGKVSDMTLFYNDRGMQTRTQRNREDCMELTIKHYQQDLLALKEEEIKLGL